MGLITGMDIYMCPEVLFIQFLRTNRHIIYTDSDEFENHMVLV